MALDHPATVGRLTVLNIVPTLDQFERMAEGISLEYYPWYFLTSERGVLHPSHDRVVDGRPRGRR
jgi:hypothetical protein